MEEAKKPQPHTEHNADMDEQNNTTDSTNLPSEHALEYVSMTAKERRKLKYREEKDKLAELSFWRKIQYVLTYYTWKFIGLAAIIAIVIFIGRQIYIATRPVAMDIALVNDSSNGVFGERVEELFRAYDDAPEDALYLVDNNFDLHPKETYTSATMSYYAKMMSVMTHESTHIVICDADVIDYYAIDGYVMELKHALPEDIFLAVEDRLYTCPGPVPDSDFYAIDISDMEFTKETEIHLEQPYLLIPAVLGPENREIAFNFIRMILDMENHTFSVE